MDNFSEFTDLVRMHELSGFEPYSKHYVANPYPTLARLRAEQPIFFDEDWRLSFFTRYEDVKSIMKNRQQFGRDFRNRLSVDEVDAGLVERLFPSDAPMWVKFVRESFIDFEPPEHTRLRSLVSQAFTRRSSASFRPSLTTLAESILGELRDGVAFDAIETFATPIPVSLIAELMGIGSSHHQQLVDWSAATVIPYDNNATVADRAKAERATVDFVNFLREEIERRRHDPGTDLISSMLIVEENGETLTEDEIIATAILTLNAGHEATVQALGNALLALANHPEQYRSLVEDPEKIPAAVDELLRFDTPLQMFERWVLEDCEVSGYTLKKGQKVGLLMGSANHDEAAFKGDTEALDLTRDSRHHIAFGAGLHHCVGAPLAKLEIEVALRVLVSRAKSIRVVGKLPERKPSLIFRGLSALPLQMVSQ
jgi:cytochrome P450